MNSQEIEQQIIKFWKARKIIEKVRSQNSKSKKKFYFMDGPPYATGHIHMGTALNKILKDIAIRCRRMQGYDVFDRPGYDTHGVPIEFQIEKEIGSKSRQDIEKFGIKKFVEKSRQYATQYIDIMNKEFENLGVWMDWKNPYLTLDDDYIEAIWWTFKKAHEKNLLYLGKYPVHVCPRCETAVAYNEIIYKKQEDTSIYVKFPIKNKKDQKNKFLLIWTTTPWTLPGNTGIMAHPDYVYVEIELSNGEIWILAKELLSKIMSALGLGYTVKKEFKGKELQGLEYENPLAKNLALKNVKNAYKVILSGRYVNLEEGTGLVHIAPGHGKEDFDAAKPYKLDIISPVNIDGTLTKETGKYAGKKARLVDSEIIADLEKDGFLVYKHAYTHDYPVCWRCKEPLLMLSVPQWFFKISGIQKKMLSENEQTVWVPIWMKSRMKAWLEGISDWPISRQRYWGTPLPIWICENEKCKEKIVIGSIAELKKLSGMKKINLHKPDIDNVKIKCKKPKCSGNMKRVPEVLDVWFDSGVSSWAALGFPQNDRLFKQFWPADLNVEATEQVRGWWNSQLILSTIAFNKKPYKTIMVHGMVLDIGKKKMSKSLGNITSPENIINRYGRDYLRYYLASVSRGEDFAFDENALSDVRKFFDILQNVHNFISLIGFKQVEKIQAKKIEDKWLLSRLNSLIKQVAEYYNNYLFFKVIESVEKFVINDFSRTYIKMIRERADNQDKDIQNILNYVMFSILKLIAPLVPHITEHLYKEVYKKAKINNLKNSKESIHLCEFPKVDEGKIDKKLEAMFDSALQVIEKGLAERDRKGIGLKWPLAKATVILTTVLDPANYLREIIKKQLNVKDLGIKLGADFSVELDTKLTPELEAEGYAREISRKVQAARKKAGLDKKDFIDLVLIVDEGFVDTLKLNEQFIKQRTNAKKILITDWEFKLAGYKNKTDDKIKNMKINIFFNKL